MRNIFQIFIVLFCGINLFAQVDTLVVYDVRTKETSLILPPNIDSLSEFEHTNWNKGLLPGFTELDISPPAFTPPNSGFTYLERANLKFNVTDYPIRTAVKIFRFVEDSLVQRCSGIMIANNLILTSAHCMFFNFDTSNVRFFSDSLLIIPAYDEGTEHQNIMNSVSSKYYIPKTWYENKSWDDIALVELQEPIGLKTGWIGIAFNEDSSIIENSVFHKLSYPGAADPSDTTKVYNGDTLYYNYGTLDLIQHNYLGFNLFGIPGQSGSSLFYTDNSVYYTIGVLSWSLGSRHYRINRDTFYILRNIIENVSSTVVKNINDLPLNYSLEQNFPNPFNSTTTISFTLNRSYLVALKIYDLSGKLVKTLLYENKMPGRYEVIWNGKETHGRMVSTGIYYYVLKIGENQLLSKRMLLLK